MWVLAQFAVSTDSVNTVLQLFDQYYWTVKVINIALLVVFTVPKPFNGIQFRLARSGWQIHLGTKWNQWPQGWKASILPSFPNTTKVTYSFSSILLVQQGQHTVVVPCYKCNNSNIQLYFHPASTTLVIYKYNSILQVRSIAAYSYSSIQ